MFNESDFYVGYLPAPRTLKRSMRRMAIGFGILTAMAGVVLVAGQSPFAPSMFEFRQYREFHGTLLAEPYPALAIPGRGLPWLLVAPGKHGAGGLRELDGREVSLKGERIFRGSDHVIELLPGSLIAGKQGGLSVQPIDLGPAQLTGEIVDSKCYFGVMNPGNGKVHRDCAARCIGGGIPAAFLVRDASGGAVTILLAKLPGELLDHIAEPVTIRGRLSRSSGRLILYAE